ncbi:MAG: squalene/phytoene synthase family protein [Candidatus Peribacteria bacterium]|nr:MAG: squalene/phytoene synthase family protein [Candidatus Peribacteria bacterium]
MMCQTTGIDTAARPAAQKLGEAMQYTNFLRDIAEDYTVHQRIYIPQERLAAYGLSHKDLQDYCEGKAWGNQWKEFLEQELVFTRQLYAQAAQ